MTWRVLYCQTGRELSARAEVLGLGVEALCPFERFRRFRSVRGTKVLTWINIPLFQGYIFVNSDNFLDLLDIRGVVSVVKMGTRPLAVPSSVISALRAISDSSGLVRTEDQSKPSAHFRAKPGDTFRVKSGPLAGFIGKIKSLSHLDESGRISAWVTMLGSEREVSLHFSEALIGGEHQAA